MPVPKAVQDKVAGLEQNLARTEDESAQTVCRLEIAEALSPYDIRRSRTLARRLLKSAGDTTPPRVVFGCHNLLAELAILEADLAAAEPHEQLYWKMAHEDGKPTWVACAHALRGWLLCAQGRYPEARRMLEQAIELNPEQEWSLGTRGPLERLAYLSALEEKPEQAADCYRRCLEYDRRSGDDLRRVGTLISLAIQLDALGRWDEALTHLYRGIELAERLGCEDRSCHGRVAIAEIMTKRGDLEGALARLRSALDQVQDNPELRYLRPWPLLLIGRASLLAGDTAAAAAAFERAIDECRIPADRPTLVAALCGAAETDIMLGRRKSRTRHLDQAAKVAQELGLRRFQGEVLRVQALAAAAKKDPEQSDRLFTDAEQSFEASGQAYDLALCRLQHGQVLTDAGQVEPARRLLGLAAESSRRLGATWLFGAASRAQYALELGQDREHALLQGLASLAAHRLEPIGRLERGLAMLLEALRYDSGVVLLGAQPVAVCGQPDQTRARMHLLERRTLDSEVELFIAVRRGREPLGALFLQRDQPFSTPAGPRTYDRVSWFVAEQLEELARIPERYGVGRTDIPGLCFRGLIGGNPIMKENLRTISKAARVDIPVLVCGESGTGKELVARALHESGPRWDQPFVPINCAAVPAGLLEAEFFGVAPGAATGVAARRGRFELADTGTVFLDEVADMGLDLQSRLLRVLQEGVFEPVGSERSVKVDVRVVAATNQDLDRLVKTGRFRPDLFYRLNGCAVELPPLRERREDIPLFARYFIAEANREFGRAVKGADAACAQCLAAYSWPGNIRELRHVIERAVLLAASDTLTTDDLPPAIRELQAAFYATGSEPPSRRQVRRRTLDHAQRDLVLDSLKRTGWNVTQAADLAGYSRAQFYRLLKKHGIPTRPEHESNA